MKLVRLSLALSLMTAACGGGDPDPEPCGGSGNACLFMGQTGRAGLGHDGVPPDQVRLYLPQDLAFGPDGHPYVLDWNNHRVRTVTDAGVVETVVGTGELGDATPGPATQMRLNHPTHVSFDPNGRLILSAWHNSKVMAVNLSTGQATLLCGTGARSYGGDGGPADEAALDLPVATAFDSQGRVLIMDQGNQRVRRVEGGVIDTIVGPQGELLPEGWVRICAENGSGQPVCNEMCREEEADDPECESEPVPLKAQGFAGDGGPATEALLYLPFTQSAPPAGRMEMGPDDTLYIADTGNHRIRTVGPDDVIRTVAGTGPAELDRDYEGGHDGDGGPATQARLSFPRDVAVAPDGTYYIADTGNSCVRRVTPDGTIDTAAGVCGQGGDEGLGGPAGAAHLDRPYGVALDGDGNLYVADTHNHRIVVVWR